MPIITSMLDTDFYKFTMQQAVFKKFPDVEVEYTFKNRTKDVWLSGAIYWDKINKEIDHMATLRFTQGELDYLKSLGLFSRGYLEYLRQFRFNPDSIIPTGNSDGVDFTIAGTWLNTILWEVPLLAIVSELYSGTCKADPYVTSAKNLYDKIYSMHLSNTLHFADFGTRRRYSRDWQDTVVKKLASKDPFTGFVGTSNVLFAKKHNVRPIGTMAHEFIQAMQAMVRLSDSQKYAFQTWADVYRGDLGIALSDTLGMDAFFTDFDVYFSKLFDGARHDSGSPDVWCDRLIEHYRAMGIDPMTKTAVFSDGLTFPEMIRLHKKFSDKINVSFGIGTNLTNDCGIKPLQIVIKMSRCDGRPVAKISDSPGKQMCEDKEYLKYLASVFNISKEKE